MYQLRVLDAPHALAECGMRRQPPPVPIPYRRHPSDAVVVAQRQLARGFELLEGVPRAAVLQIVNAGQPGGGRQWQGGTDRGAELLVARLGYAVAHQILSVFEQHARRMAAFVALD